MLDRMVEKARQQEVCSRKDTPTERRFCTMLVSRTGKSNRLLSAPMRQSDRGSTGWNTCSNPTVGSVMRSPSMRRRSKSTPRRSMSGRQSIVRRWKCYSRCFARPLKPGCVVVPQGGAEGLPRSPTSAGRPRPLVRLATRTARVRVWTGNVGKSVTHRSLVRSVQVPNQALLASISVSELHRLHQIMAYSLRHSPQCNAL